mgnify:CR=1 FL=1
MSDESQRVWGRLNGVGKPDRDQLFAEFQCACRERMAQGAIEYGDASFGAEPEELRREIEEELLDVAVWSWILWCRVRGLSP